jgi:hypothetical protein
MAKEKIGLTDEQVREMLDAMYKASNIEEEDDED